MRRGEPLPPVLLAPGVVSEPRALARFGDLSQVLLPVGPVRTGGPDPVTAAPPVHGTGVGGVEHASSPGYAVPAALELVRWCASRGLACVLSVRGRTTGDLAEVVQRVRLSLDADAVAAVEVDLRGADDQTVLKSMARVREAAPRDLLLLARVSALDPDLVAVARAAVAGGAGAIIVCGSVRLGPDRWWSGPSTAAASRAGVQVLVEAAGEQRWPGARLVAAGGVHDVPTARAVLSAGADAVQLGTVLWADPTLLWRITEALTSQTDPTGSAIHAGSSGAPDSPGCPAFRPT